MNHLLRELAPITDAGWEELEEEAREHLAVHLAARKLVDFSGPHGWERSATNLGRTEPLSPAPVDGVDARRRRVLPLVEPRAWFSLSRAELERADQGADDVDLDPLDEAARRIALAENTAVFNGWPQAGITGIAEAVPARPAPAHRRHERVPGPGRGRRRDPDVQRHRGPVRPRARARRLQARGRDAPSAAATCSSTTCARSPAARSSGRPGSTARSW